MIATQIQATARALQLAGLPVRFAVEEAFALETADWPSDRREKLRVALSLTKAGA